MDDLISRNAVIAEFSCCQLTPNGGIDVNYAIDFLKQLPSAQRTGRWIWEKEGYHCSECHTYESTTNILVWNFKFCPNCGCAMEGEEE